MRRWMLWAALFAVGCAEGQRAGEMPVHLDFGGVSDGGMTADLAHDLATSSADLASGDLAVVPTCAVTFAYQGTGASVAVAGEFNGWQPAIMTGTSLTMQLAPGLHAYKLVVDGAWQLDPDQPLRKWVGSSENSAVRVADCNLPSLRVIDKSVGSGRFTAKIALEPGASGAALDVNSVRIEARHKSATVPFTIRGDEISIDAPNLPDGKYTLVLQAGDQLGRAAKPLRLVFWIESKPFEWRDALIYMVMTDRFRDGNPANNPPRNSAVEERADFRGGDLEGVRAAIADGTFDQLGVRALWLSPFHENPAGNYIADDGVHQVMGYHGYWPVKARTVEPRIGGAAALKALVEEAHAHGIRILQDYVVNHVHQDHEYVKTHPEWFRTGCVCGKGSCDWTANRLECQFADYLPDVDWSKSEVVEQFSDDAVWWMDEFDLDGLRVDAVKHVEDIAVFNLTNRLRQEFEAAGTRVFLTGETAMGWNDCGVACNAGEYGTINRYMGKHGLDGQADFVLYHAVPNRVFAYRDKGMLHVDYWTQQSLQQYTSGAVMTPYIGSHDTSRFVTYSTYRGQDPSHDRGVPGNKWSNIAGAPDGAEAYARHRAALSWLLTAPGAPLIYYGDEYGEWGGADPNNRAMWRGSGLSTDEAATLAWARALGKARQELAALRRGDYQSLFSSEDVLVFARTAGSEVAIVALSRLAATQTVQVNLPSSIAAGTVLKDRLGGPSVTAAAQVTLNINTASIYAP
jgi:neopullulanase